MKKIIPLILLMAVTNLFFTACQDDEGPYIQPNFASEDDIEEEEQEDTTIALNQRDLELFTLDSATLTATVTGGANSGRVIWRTDDQDILEVDQQGNVTALNVGNAYVVAKQGDATAVCKVTVRPSVYAVGHEYTELADDNTATIWKNGTPTALLDGTNDSRATDIYVTQNDVFVCGFEVFDEEGVSSFIGKVWKNGELLYDLPDTIAQGIFVFENDVYIGAGTSIWKNGELFYDLSGSVVSIFVKDNTVYTAGITQSPIHPTLWVDSAEEQLMFVDPLAFLGVALGVFVTDENEYVVGLENSFNDISAIIWKNGEPRKLENTEQTSVARSVFVDSDGNVYVAGELGKETGGDMPVLWKNDEEHTALSDEGTANSVFVYNNDVYVGGVDFVGAKIWLNGNPLPLIFTQEFAFINAVFVR